MSTARKTLAFRMVAERLTNPLGELLGSVAELWSMLVISEGIPLADTSPFGVLPGDSEVSRRPSVQATPAARIDLPERKRSASPERSADPSSVHTTATAAPLFSFRGSRVASQRSAEGKPGKVPSPPRYDEHGAVQSSAGKLGPVSESVVGDQEKPDAPMFSGMRDPARKPAIPSEAAASLQAGSLSAGELPPAHPGQPPRPFEILDELASELLAARPAPVAVQNPSVGVGNHDLSLAPATTQVGTELRQSRNMQAVGRNYQSEPDVLRAFEASPTEKPFLREHAAVAAQLPPGIQKFPEVAASIAASQGSHVDAETLAALVNEILAEQARRHGVDLS